MENITLFLEKKKNNNDKLLPLFYVKCCFGLFFKGKNASGDIRECIETSCAKIPKFGNLQNFLQIAR